MPLLTGTVNCIQVGDDYSFFSINETSTGDTEFLILWFGPSDPSAYTRILQSTWLSLLRDALGNGATVKVFHPNGDARISSVELSKL